jgi:2,4-dichlorophenol 6-monooxygenase
MTSEVTFGGVDIRVPSVDVASIGAGGGSIASVAGGTLTVGPLSAGSTPGPAGDELGRLRTYHHGGSGGYFGLTPCDAVNIPQHKLEPVLAEALLARGGRLLFNTECLEIRETGSHVLARVRNRVTGETFWIEAGYLIGADGANSIVAEQIGLEFEGEAGWGAAVNVWIKADLRHAPRSQIAPAWTSR